MTTSYDTPYRLPDMVRNRLTVAECDVDAVYEHEPLNLYAADLFLAMQRDKSRSYRIIEDYHKRARMARRRY